MFSSLAALNDIIVPARDPIGIKLLRLMGWREGRGVGANRIKKPPPPEVKKGAVIGPQIPEEILNSLRYC